MIPVPAHLQSNHAYETHFIPSTAKEAYFDSARGAWILSSYSDVSAALRERGLVQTSLEGNEFPDTEDEAARARLFARLRAEMVEIHAGRWITEMRYGAETRIRELAAREKVDLVGDFAHPWSVAMLIKMSGAPSSLAPDIARISAALLYKKGFNLDLEKVSTPSCLREAKVNCSRSDEPEIELDAFFKHQTPAISRMLFLAMGQSLPQYLAKSWLALLSNPDQMELLAAEPARMPKASAELLRYAGIVHTLHRKALRNIAIGSAQIENGHQVQLRVASANFDPKAFDGPHRLDITRGGPPHLSLSAGLHACVGAALVRQVFAETTSALLSAQPKFVKNERIVWMGGSTLCWPLMVWVNWGAGLP
jgi:cytochrome P450